MALEKLWTRLYSTLCKVGRIGSQGLLTWSATWHFFYIKTLIKSEFTGIQQNQYLGITFYVKTQIKADFTGI